MVVQHNLTAMNSNRMLNVTTGAQAKSTEKLSSGYKINRAADDAAGLSISEKMRRQIRGLTQASTNAQDGISSVQTAEGALGEIHDMLQRMDELATKAANGTMSEGDRQNVQDEIDQLLTEIDRVSETTKFNETYLLKGNADGTKSDMSIAAKDAGLAGKLVDNGKTATFSLEKALENGDKVNIAGKEYMIGDGSGAASATKYASINDSTLDAKTMSVGDSIYDKDADKTYTLVGKVDNSASSIYVSGKTEFTVTAANGEEIKYAIDSADDHSTDPQKLSAANAQHIVADALAAGSTVTMTKDGEGKAVDYQIVDKLDDGSVSGNVEKSIVGTDGKTQTVTVSGFKTSTGVTPAEGDKVILGGEETVLTDSNPATRDKINDIIDVLNKGDQVTITTKDQADAGVTKSFTIADKTNEAACEYSKEDLKDIIGDFDEVAFTVSTTNTKAIALIKTTEGNSSFNGSAASASLTAVPEEKSTNSNDVISASQAYSKMANELQKASSIGTDEGKEAKVSSGGDGTFTITKGAVEVKDALSFNLHVGADADMTNKIGVKIESMSTAALGLKGLNVKDNSGTNATYSIDSIEAAIKKVSEQRSALGAVQNRLEHTVKNVDNVVENTTSAESQIRDTDMATEMVQYSKNNILAQAGQSMLAQANQSNQGVLSLLG